MLNKTKLSTALVISLAILCVFAVNSLAFADPITITTNSPLPSGQVNSAYNTQINAANGTLFDCWGYDEFEPPYIGSGYVWELTAGSLPPGLSLTTTNGGPGYGWWDQADNFYTSLYPGQAKLVGTPTQAGTYNFTLRAKGYPNDPVTKEFSLTINGQPLNITTSSMPDGEVNYAYTKTLTAVGGATPYTWSVLTGSLPGGLNLNSSTGVISGTPTASGTGNFTVKAVSNDSQEDTQSLSIYIAPALSITTQSPLPSATLSGTYNTTINSTGGILYDCWGYDEYEPPYIGSGYRVSIISGTLPAGLSLTTSNGGPGYGWWDQADTFYTNEPYPGQAKLVGTPAQYGTFLFTLQIRDYLGVIVTRDYSLTVAIPQLNITTASLPDGEVNHPYSAGLNYSGGLPPYTWSILSGSLPAGLNLNSSTGAITGTPESNGTANFTIKVISNDSQEDTQPLSIYIAPALVITTQSPLNSATINIAYNNTLSATGGILYDCWGYDEYEPPYICSGYRFSIISGTLPAGISLISTNGGPGYGWWDQADTFYSSDPYPGLPKLSGTPTVTGVYNATLRLSDFPGAQPTLDFSLTVNYAFNITTQSLPYSHKNVPYAVALSASGAPAPYTWTIVSGSLPEGITLNSSTGLLSGTPTVTGTYYITFQVAGLDPVLNPIAQKQLLLDARDTWDNLTGGDHQGADWTITANTTIGGEHFNVGDFTVNQGVTVEFQTGSGREVQAQGDIVINGILKSTSRGVINLKTDGNITIGVNGKIDLTDSNLNGIEDPTLTNGLDAPDYEKGGGGGGYGGTGGAGGGNPNSGGAARGTAYFDDIAQGSDGGSVVPPGPADPYGGKGGVCLLYAAQTILVQGIIDASGTDGEDGIQVDDLFTGGAGGGSGGGILFRAYRIAVTGKIYADGGNGGVPAPYSAMNGGGGASGGRVKFFAAFMEYNYNESNPNDPNNNIYVRGGSAGSSSAQPGQAGTFFAKPMQALPRNQVYEGVGVNPYLGNLTLSLPMSVKGKVVPLIMPSLPNCNTDDGITRLFALTYMSTGNPSSMGALGAYWSHSYEIWLDPTPINGDILYNHDNRSDRFTKNPDNSYTAPAGLYAKLEKQQDGTYILTGRFGDKRYFDALGRLTRWESPSGTFLVFQYNNSSYPCYPTDITDNWGRALQLVYYSNGLLYHVIEVYANRTWELGFNAKHCFNLLTIPGGKTIPIAYLSEGQNNQGTLSNADYLVESMKDHAGQTFLTNTYEQSTLSVNLGKPIQQTLGHGGVYHISYGVDANGQYAEVLDMNGNLRKEYFNTSGFMTSIRQYTNRNLRPEEPEFYATTFTCNANYETTGVFFPMGNSIVNAFDTTNSDPLARGNLLSSTQKPIPGAGAPPDIIESMTYESRFQRLKTYTNPLQKTSTLFYEWEEATEGDLNNDGITDRSTDKTVKLVCPVVTLGLAAQGGNQTRDLLFRWNSSGQPTGSTDPDGFMNAIDYYTDATRKGFLWKSILDSATGGKQITSSQDYNSAGDVVSSTDAKGNTTGYQVSTLGLMEQINPPAPFTNKYRKMFHYNDNGVMDYLDIENTDNPAGTPDEYNMQWIRTSFIRGVMDNLTSYIQQVSATQNITTGIGYDPCLNADLLTKPEGNQVKKSFDERGLPWETIYGYGTSIWGSYKNYYDANGNHVKTVDPRGYENTTLRDKFGRYVGSIDALGNRTDIELNACGSTLSVTRKNSAGVILSVTKYLRDEAERVYETQVWKGNPLTQQPPSQGEWSTTQYKFNKRSLVELVRDALNHDSITEYDALGRPIKTQDAKGNMVELTLDANSNPEVMVETEILNSPSQEYTTTNVFDELDRLKSTTRTGDNATRQFGYNSRNDMVSLIDAEGNTSYSIVDGLSRLRKTLQDLRVGGKGTGNIIDTIVTMQEWDDNSRRTSMTDDKGNISSWIYDARDRQTDEYLPGGIHTNWQYDLANNVTQKTDPNGSVIVQTFNAVNMITGRTITRATGVIGTTWEEFAYNGAYQMTQARNDDSTVNMKYNSFGLTTEEEQILGAYSGIVSSGYNIVGKQTGLTYPSGKALTFVPDELNRNKEIKDSVNNIIAKYTYAGPGYRVTEREYLNQTKLTVGWDDNRRITSYSHVTISNPPSVIAGFEYAYDKEDNKKYEKRTHENKGDAYNLDSIYRLVGVKYGVTNLASTSEYADYTTWEKKEEYNFDGVGNRESLVTTVWGQNPVTKNYSTNALNQYYQIDSQSLSYDANGNLKDDGANLYAYDYANRLVEVRRKSDNELIASFKYDALGRRISKTNNQQQTTKYYLDGGRVIEERNGSDTLLATYVHGNGIDELLTMERNSNTYYFHENTQGSIYAVTNSSGVIVEKYIYDPYGKVSIFDGSGNPLQQSAIGDSYLYTGREWDAEIGLYYYRARYYSPALGRFLARDPMGYSDGMNLYAYVINNPVNFLDPFGLWKSSPNEEGNVYVAEYGDTIESLKDLLAQAYITLESFLIIRAEGRNVTYSPARLAQGIIKPGDAFKVSIRMQYAIVLENEGRPHPSTIIQPSDYDQYDDVLDFMMKYVGIPCGGAVVITGAIYGGSAAGTYVAAQPIVTTVATTVAVKAKELAQAAAAIAGKAANAVSGIWNWVVQLGNAGFARLPLPSGAENIFTKTIGLSKAYDKIVVAVTRGYGFHLHLILKGGEKIYRSFNTLQEALDWLPRGLRNNQEVINAIKKGFESIERATGE